MVGCPVKVGDVNIVDLLSLVTLPKLTSVAVKDNAVLKLAADKADIVLSALNLGKVIADGLVRVNIFCPTVVPPRLVLPVAAVNPVEPPFHLFLAT
jgi:hypothetical protein